jgi:hypothetical protein
LGDPVVISLFLFLASPLVPEHQLLLDVFVSTVLLALLLILVPVVFALSSSLCKQGLGDFMFLLIKNQQVDGMRQPLSSFLGVLLAWTSLIGD